MKSASIKPIESTRSTPSAEPVRDYFQERAARAIPGEAKRILEKAGRGKPPMPGDEIE
ncbi:MAG: hypothetical protein J0L64_22620 [Acidobacteria bacterium]|nr:hypothetical protein [Acidobacteriota bacterium]